MALQNIAAASWLSCTITCCRYTGLTVDKHLATWAQYDAMFNNNYSRVITNYGAQYSGHFGIGTVRVAIPSGYAEGVDYCKITATEVHAGTSPYPNTEGNNISMSYNTPNSIQDGYYYVTGYNVVNFSVVEFTVMLDALATIGSGISYFGGMVTRRPVNIANDVVVDGVQRNDYEFTEYNTLTEPYTTAYPVVDSITYFDPLKDITAHKLNIILSTYDLAQYEEPFDEDINDTLSAVPSIYSGRISDSTGTTTSDTETDETTGITNATGKTTGRTTERIRPAYAAGSRSSTSFKCGSISYTLDGIQAFLRSYKMVEAVSKIYGAGIPNPVYSAYAPYVVSNAGTLGTIEGANAAQEVTIPGAEYNSALNVYTGGIINRQDKRTYYGRYFVLISLSSGQTQVINAADVALKDDHTIYIDVATDPSPTGGIYARIRKTGEDPDAIGADIPMAMLPGGVRSTAWRSILIQTEIDGKGVELGQTYRAAEIDIDRYIAEQNQAAVDAQYNLTAGGGYLLKNAGNEYGLATLRESNRYAMQQFSTGNEQRLGRFLTGSISPLAGMTDANNGTTEGISNARSRLRQGAFGAASNAALGALSATYDYQNAAMQLGNQANLAQIQASQMMEQGAYNTQNLAAQANAATAMAQAQIDKINLMGDRLESAPSISFLSDEKRGLLTGSDDKFVIMDVKMSAMDTARFTQMLKNFGQACYDPVSEVTDICPNKGYWNYWKVEISDLNYPVPYGVGSPTDGTTGENPNRRNNNRFPAWVLSAAADQLRSGGWFYNAPTE